MKKEMGKLVPLFLLILMVAFPLANGKTLSTTVILPSDIHTTHTKAKTVTSITDDITAVGNDDRLSKLDRFDKKVEMAREKIENIPIPVEIDRRATEIFDTSIGGISPRWNYPDNQTYSDTTITWSDGASTITDKVIILDNATLILDKYTLTLNASGFGKSGILLLNGSQLILRNSTITYDAMSGYQYFIYAEANTTLVVNDSVIEYAGWSPAYPGVQIGFNYSTIGVEANVLIENGTFKNCYNGLTVFGKTNVVINGATFDGPTNYGISIDGAATVVASGVDFTGGRAAVYAMNGSATIKLSTFNNINGYAVTSEAYTSVTVANSTFSGNDGIYLVNATATIENNTFTGTQYGVYVFNTTNPVSIKNNEFDSTNSYGVFLEESTGVTVSGNTFVETYLFIDGSKVEAFNSHTITSDNIVNGSSLYYIVDQDNPAIPSGGGEYILANCTNIIIKDMNITNMLFPYEIAFSNFTITNVTVTNNVYGFYVTRLYDGAKIEKSLFMGNGYGIYAKATKLLITGNDTYPTMFTGNTYGIYATASDISMEYVDVYNDYISFSDSILYMSNSKIRVELTGISAYSAFYSGGASIITLDTVDIYMLANDSGDYAGDSPVSALTIYSNITMNNVHVNAICYGASYAIPVYILGSADVNIVDSVFNGTVHNESIMYVVNILLVDDVNIDGSEFYIYGYDHRIPNATLWYIESMDLIQVSNINMQNSYIFANITGNATLPYNFTDICDDDNNLLANPVFGYDLGGFTLTNVTIDAWVYWLGSINVFYDYGSSGDYVFQNSNIYLHAYGGPPDAEIFFAYGTAGSIIFDSSYIYIDLYGYGETPFYVDEHGEQQYAEPYWFYAPAFFPYGASEIRFSESTINLTVRGFGYGFIAINILSAITIYDSSIYIYGYDDGVAISFFNIIGYVETHNMYYNIKGYGASYFYGFYNRGSTVLMYDTTIMLESYGDSYIPTFINTQNWYYYKCSGSWIWYGPSMYILNNTYLEAVGSVPVGINAVNQTSVLLNYTSIIGFGTGLYLQYKCDGTVENAFFENNTVAIHLGLSEAEIRDTAFVNSKEINIEIYDSYNSTIENNNFGDTMLWGVIMGSSTNITFKNNIFDGCGIFITGDDVTHFDSHTMEGNVINGEPLRYIVGMSGGTITGSTGELIIVDSSGATVDGLGIMDSDVLIEIAFSSNITVTDSNLITGRYGIYVYESSDIAIESSVIDNCEVGVYGLESTITVDAVNLSRLSTGVFLESASITVKNSFIQTSGFGVQLYTADAVIENTEISNNQHGILAQMNSSIEIKGSVIKDSAFYGIKLYISDMFANNSVIDNSYIGIEAESADIDMYNTNITNNEEAGIDVEASSVYINGATITGNGYGILTDTSVVLVYFANIYSNTKHGIYNNANNATYYVAAYNVYWGSPYGPEYTEDADSVDPEEIYGYVIWSEALDMPYGYTPVISTITETETIVETEYTATTIFSSVAYISPVLFLGMSVAVAVVAFAIIFIAAKKLAGSKAVE